MAPRVWDYASLARGINGSQSTLFAENATSPDENIRVQDALIELNSVGNNSYGKIDQARKSRFTILTYKDNDATSKRDFGRKDLLTEGSQQTPAYNVSGPRDWSWWPAKVTPKSRMQCILEKMRVEHRVLGRMTLTM